MTISRGRLRAAVGAACALVLAVTLAGCTGANAPGAGQGTGTPAATATSTASGTAPANDSGAGDAVSDSAELARAVRELEHQHAGTAGVYAIDTETGRSMGYRDGQRFGFAST